MPQIIKYVSNYSKERTAHVARFTFFTKDVDQFKIISLSQLHQPPKTPFSQKSYH